MGTTIKSIRFADEVFAQIEVEAARLGIGPSEVVVFAVCKHLGLPIDPGVNLMTKLKSLVEMTWGTKNFPRDVTLLIFRQIKADQLLLEEYEKVTMGDNGQMDEKKRAQINRRIGKMVKKVLKAQVVGRSLPLNRDDELIETHALLEPMP